MELNNIRWRHQHFLHDTSYLQLDCLYIVAVANAIATNSQLTVSIPNEQ